MSTFSWNDAGVRRALGLRMELAEVGVEFAGVSTDSRTVQEGDIYVALIGDRFDGHDFVADAMAGGAGAAIVSRPSAGDAGVRLYPVADTLVALGELAAHRRRSLRAPVVAITGSSGKTTTKEMTAAALGATLRVHATRGNLNNRIGMPLTLLAAPDEAEAVVLELGSNQPGEIAALAQVARPDIAVITTVGESHLEQLGSLQGVMSEKLDLLRHLADSGRCVVGDEPAELAERARTLCPNIRVVGWSERADEDARPTRAEVDVFGRYEFQWRGCRAAAPMAGRHAVSNALIALAVADLLGVPARDAVRGLASAEVGSMRGEVRRMGDLTVIVDCYNANPQSVKASLDVLEGQGAAAQRVVVLGSMLELGASSDELHQRTLADALARPIDLLVVTGAFAAAARHLGVAESDRVITAAGWLEAYPALRDRLKGNEIVLLKASRGIALEGILPLIAGDFAHSAADSVEA
ncbi:MAG: UDP-N-acetylmuramoyl-tripeptide--D-alanyl-D-alanine ligase [Gemmatimonadetes bacterium]|nr:UDP-N-acetylmuramoyl-tripeptide--D-alanyl-D-alanine ligase [Gemmatimonadota bacterium]MDA1102816.1 UDP-N-acetylmuramoyl-tripeptide--D-alanyl-D-alanine ligase [Gemmatimonadota bacterium]